MNTAILIWVGIYGLAHFAWIALKPLIDNLDL